MLFILICAMIIAGVVSVFKATGVAAPYAKGVALMVMLSAAAVICLGQNYTQSLIPSVADGIAVSNAVARWIIGDNNWSIEKFGSMFERSIFVLLASIVLYPVVLTVETVVGKKKRPAQR